MEIDIDKERLAFEVVEAGSELRRAQFEDDEYANPCVQSCWEGWLAAKRHAAEVAEPVRTNLREMHNDEGEIGWYFDCDGHYIDVEKDGAGNYSIFFKDRATKADAWLDQANIPATTGIAPAAPSGESKWVGANAGPSPGDMPIDRFIKALPLPQYSTAPSGASVEGDARLTDPQIRALAVFAGGFQDDETAEWEFTDRGMIKLVRSAMSPNKEG